MAWYIQRDYDRSLFYSDPQLTEEDAETIATALSHHYDCGFSHFDDEKLSKAKRLALQQDWREREGRLSVSRLAYAPDHPGVKKDRRIYRAAKDKHGDLIDNESNKQATIASNQTPATNAESESGAQRQPSMQAFQIPSERTFEAKHRGEDAPGYAFACYVAHVAGIYQEVRRCIHEPTPAYTTTHHQTGERRLAGRDAAWVRDISRIRRDSLDTLHELRGRIIREARTGGYGDSARAELDTVEAALSRLWDASFEESTKTIWCVQDALATAERRLWDEIDHAMPVPSMNDAAPIAESESGMLSAPELAKKYNVNGEALRKRLDRWRGSHMNGEWIEPDKSYRRPNSPKYLYRVDAVMPIIRQLQNASGASA